MNVTPLGISVKTYKKPETPPQKADNTFDTQKETTGLTSEQSLAVKNSFVTILNLKEVEKSANANNFDSTDKISNYLLEQYGIESSFTNLDTAKLALESIEDFVKLNSKDMFKGLKIDSFEDNSEEFGWCTSSDYRDKSFTLSFNNSPSKEDIIQTTKDLYDNCYIGSDNPKYLFYEGLSEFLNFNYNPYAYTANFREKNLSDLSKTAARKMGAYGLNSIARFDSTYLATKMCKMSTPPIADILYSEMAGAPIKTPKTEPIKEYGGAKLEFKTVEEANNYVKEKYGIKADFINLRAANLTASAIEDFVNLNNNPDMFRGLEIKSGIELNTNVLGSMYSRYNYDTDTPVESYVSLNLAYDWERHDETAERNYNRAHYASKSPKYSIYHELAHWLDFKQNPRDYSVSCDRFNKYGYYINETGKRKYGKVSGYAAMVSTPEFRAEYVAARMCGLKFPKSVNEDFENSMNGAKLHLNFPNLD